MYEVVTDSIPYPELLKGKIKPFKFNVMVVNDDYRPQFDSPIKSSLKNLIERCWSKYPEERPTVENIFKKLAYNTDDSIDDLYDQSNSEDDNDDDNKYYLDERILVQLMIKVIQKMIMIMMLKLTILPYILKTWSSLNRRWLK